MTLSLKAVLDQAAKEFKIEKDEAKRTWKEIPKNYCFGKKQVERVAEIALSAKQAEVEKEIYKLIEEDCFIDDYKDGLPGFCRTCANIKACKALRELRKRLLAKEKEGE